METRTNELELSFDYSKIDEKYDFYQIRTSEKYIPRGARVLDLPDSDVKALSIAFEGGTSAFAMFGKYAIRLNQLQSAIKDSTITVKKVEAKELKPYILGRLFLYSLSSSEFPDFAFNNLTGKFYLFLPGKKLKYLKALQIDIACSDEVVRLEAFATTFTRVDAFKSQNSLKGLPKYSFSVNQTMKRALDGANGANLYVHKSVSDTKTRIPFLNFSEKTISQSKVYLVYQTADLYNKKFDGMSYMEFKTRQIEKRVTSKKDKEFFDAVSMALMRKTINFVNLDENPEDEEIFHILVEKTSRLVPYCLVDESEQIKDDCLNVVLIHNEEYYLKNKIEDPYKKFKRNQVIQCVTAEDAGAKDEEIIFKTILKELAIKDDIIHERQITLDDWPSFHFDGKWVFGLWQDDVSYFLEVMPDGKFSTIHPSGPFQEFQTEYYRDLDYLLQSTKGKGRTLVADDKGNVILISSTGAVTLPEKEVLSNSSRSEENVQKNMAGLTGINLYQDGNSLLYNVGSFEKGMPSSLPNASLIYESHADKGNNVMPYLLETMSVLFVKWNSYTVLPYPIKYLREWVEMETSGKEKKKK